MPRKIVSALALALVMVISAVTPAAAARSLAYQQDVRHDGRVRERDLEPPFRVAWSRRMHAPSYPLIAHDRVFMVTRPRAGSSGTTLWALNAKNGHAIWKKDAGGTYHWANAAYDRGSILFLNVDGWLSDLRAATGATRWVTKLPHQYMFDAPPTASDGVVYAGGSGTGGDVYAVRERTGRVFWTHPTITGDESSPTLSRGDVFVSYACGHVYALARATGHLDWKTSSGCSGGGGATAALHGGLLYLRNPSDGDSIVSARDGSTVGLFSSETIPAFTSGLMVENTGATVTAVSLKTGTDVWSNALDGNVVSAPLIVNSYVVVASSDGTLWALRHRTGDVVWHKELGIAIAGPDERNVGRPLTGLGAGGGLVIVPGANRLVALRPA